MKNEEFATAYLKFDIIHFFVFIVILFYCFN